MEAGEPGRGVDPGHLHTGRRYQQGGIARSAPEVQYPLVRLDAGRAIAARAAGRNCAVVVS